MREIDDAALRVLQMYAWPGNVRELENVILQAMIFARNGRISMDVLPAEVRRAADSPARETPLTKEELQQERQRRTAKIVDELESQFLTRLMKIADGNITRAARLSGYDRRQIQNMLKKHQISAKTYRQSSAKTRPE